jgi:hypothetical protein
MICLRDVVGCCLLEDSEIHMVVLLLVVLDDGYSAWDWFDWDALMICLRDVVGCCLLEDSEIHMVVLLLVVFFLALEEMPYDLWALRGGFVDLEHFRVEVEAIDATI